MASSSSPPPHQIGELCAVEKEIRGRSPDERRAARHERSRPVLDAMKPWIEQTLSTLSQKSATAKAFGYAITRWEALRTLLRRRQDRDRQQRRGTIVTLRCARAQELFVRR